MRKIAYCLIPALLLSSQAALADGPRWRVTETSGDVQIMRAGVSRTASRGSMLYSGDIVVTGNRGRAVVTRGEEYMIVSPQSRLRLPGDTRSGGVTRIIEEVGNVIYNVQRRNHEHFGVETPYLAAVVKGTTFSVTVGPEGSSVQVLEGLVEVSTLDGGASRLVEPGSVALVAAGNRYQLTVEGSDTDVIDSPNAPEGDDSEGETPSVTVAFTAPSTEGGYGREISNEIRANPVSIGALTGGFIGGHTDVGTEFAAIVESANGSSELMTRGDGDNGHGNDDSGFDPSNPGSGNGNGGSANAGGNGNGGSGNASGNGNGGSANAGGNGNGGSGNASGNGNGGSANAGGNGNGGSGNAGGNGNGGNGNGGSGNAGGNGNGGSGNAGGNGNGGSANAGGNGNGGSGNAGGNGNGAGNLPNRN